MKASKDEKKRRVFARLLAQELKNVSAGTDVGPTCVSTAPPPGGGSSDVTNLEGDNDGPLKN